MMRGRFWVRHAYLPGDDLHIVDGQVVLGADIRGLPSVPTASGIEERKTE